MRFGGKVKTFLPTDQIISENNFLKIVNGSNGDFSGVSKISCNYMYLCVYARVYGLKMYREKFLQKSCENIW